MSSGEEEAAYREVRELCLTDPLAARRRLTALLDANDPLLEKIIEQAGGPNDGRLRQTIARSLQRRPEVRLFTAQLREWRARETDEFTLSAIEDALETVPAASPRGRRLEGPGDLAATYRYLSSRLRHRVLNAMPRAGLNADQLRAAILQSGAANLDDLLRLLDELTDSLRAVQSSVDFDDGTATFERQILDLPSWLKALATKYKQAFKEVTLRIDAEEDSAKIIATHFLLETIFINLWDNSRQAVDGRCVITVGIRVNRNTVTVQVIDNGPGLTADDAERAFQFQHSSTRRPGRGHMEVGEAVRRLAGKAVVRKLDGPGYRVVISFPRGDL